MEWSKIKNIIILILVGLNVFLLALVAVRESKSAHYQEEARAGVLSALERSGIQFLPEKVPADMELTPLTVTRSREREQSMAQALLGPVEREDTGGSVRVVYTGTGGTASFSSDGRFSFELNDQALATEGDTPARAGAACLEQMGLQAVLVETRSEGEDTLLIYRQNWEEVPLFSCQVILTYRDGTLRRIEGEYLEGAAVPAQGKSLDTLTVLVRFLAGMNESGYVCSRIDAMTAGYLSSVSAARPVVQLTPVWYITTDTGSYYLDALTGALTQAG